MNLIDSIPCSPDQKVLETFDDILILARKDTDKLFALHKEARNLDLFRDISNKLVPSFSVLHNLVLDGRGLLVLFFALQLSDVVISVVLE